MLSVFFHTGDIGDIIASLPAVRELGGGDYIIGFREGNCRESMFGARFNAIRPLLEAQSYIKSVKWDSNAKDITYDFSAFRQSHIRGEDLATWQARHIGVLIDLDPWLRVEPSKKSKGKTIIARSSRYHNPAFAWKQALKGRDCLFVGLESEHAAFELEFKAKVTYAPTEDLLELAQLIAGAELFIGNQSCPFWIAAGLGVSLMQETWQHDPNSIIERENAVYSTEKILR